MEGGERMVSFPGGNLWGKLEEINGERGLGDQRLIRNFGGGGKEVGESS